MPLIRIAELGINPTRLEDYQATIREEMETSVGVEPRVLAIYCVAEKGNPAKAMITSRLIETEPVQLSAKGR